MCYKLNGGIWTRVNVGDANMVPYRLNVIARPYAYPTVGIAGAETPIQFFPGVSSYSVSGSDTNFKL